MTLAANFQGVRTLLLIAAVVVAAPARAADYDTTIAQAKAAMLASPERARVQARAAAATAAAASSSPEREARIAAAEWLEGEAALRMNSVDAAAPLVDRALARIGGGATKLKGDLMITRGGIHTAKADVGAALSDYQAAHNIFRAIGETRSQAIALLSIASLYREAQDFNAALRYQSQALEVYRGDPAMAVSIYNNRGTTLTELDRYDEAQAQFAQALAGARAVKSRLLEVRILGNIARLQVKKGDLAAAERTLAEGNRLAASGEAAAWASQLNAIAADAALKRGDLARAEALITRSFAGVDLTTTNLAYREAHYAAYAIYAKLGRQAPALAHLQAMKRLDDQVWKLAASTNTALMAARFDSANQEARINKLKADDAARRLAMEQAQSQFQRTLFTAIAAATAIVVALLAFLLFQSRRSRIRLFASNVALEKALAAKTEFLATTSHEIRTPLNGILGMTQVMLADPQLSPASRDRVGIVHGAGLTMRALVDDILDVAKMETGNLTVEALAFDLKAMLADVTRMWGEQARAKGLTFSLDLADCPAGIVGDAGRLRQVVYNLLSNAVKFTDAGSVVVRVDCAGDRLAIAVADTGIGIAADKHAEIFESFKQADGGTTRKFGGTGLGLAICRNIARAMGGSVRVDSVAGAGATFTLDIPYVAAELAAAAVAPVSGGLLIVDRNPIARSMLKAVLEPRAGAVCFAASLAEARATLANGVVARVLIDEATAKAGDEDVLAALPGFIADAGVPVALLWAKPDDATRAALVATGAAAVIAKPIAGPALAAALFAADDGDEPLATRAA